MRFLIPITMAVLTFSLGAQEKEKAPVPTEKAVEAPKKAEPKAEVPSRNVPSASPRRTSPPRSTREPRRRAVLPPSSSRSVPTARVAAVKSAPTQLTENVTIHLKGSVSNAPDLNLSLTGIGPIFQADVVTDDQHTMLSHRYTVKPQDGGYRVEYSIGLRIRMESSRGGQSVNYEYRDVVMSGTVIAKEGKPVVISKNGDRGLSLTLGKAKE